MVEAHRQDGQSKSRRLLQGVTHRKPRKPPALLSHCCRLVAPPVVAPRPVVEAHRQDGQSKSRRLLQGVTHRKPRKPPALLSQLLSPRGTTCGCTKARGRGSPSRWSEQITPFTSGSDASEASETSSSSVAAAVASWYHLWLHQGPWSRLTVKMVRANHAVYFRESHRKPRKPPALLSQLLSPSGTTCGCTKARGRGSPSRWSEQITPFTSGSDASEASETSSSSVAAAVASWYHLWLHQGPWSRLTVKMVRANHAVYFSCCRLGSDASEAFRE